MKRLLFSALAISAFAFMLPSCSESINPADNMAQPQNPNSPDQPFIGLTNDNRLVKMNANNLANSTNLLSISNLGSGEQIISIDFRPATGQLYALSNASRLYTINTNSGRAQMIGSTAFMPAIAGSVAMIDFNPTVDRIRLVTNTGQNLRLHPELGTVVATDGNINGVANASVTGIAYNNSVSGVTTTTLYDIDASSGKLFRQIPPNDGKLEEVGSSNSGYEGATGFDISPTNAVSLLSITRNGQTSVATLDLSTGKETYLGQTGIALRDLAIPTAQVAYAVGVDNILHTINAVGPNLVSRTITGLQPGESILGIDFRPINGQLYALGSTSRIYTINVSNAAAAMAGGVLTTPLSGTKFGFDFNPTVDRLRIISNSGQNLRFNPNDFSVTVDGSLNPGTPDATATAYANNFPGATSTTMYVLNNNGLSIANPPNNGTLSLVNTFPFTVEADNGFDIGGTSNLAFFIGSSGNSNMLYNLDPGTGTARAIQPFPVRVSGFAVGLGF